MEGGVREDERIHHEGTKDTKDDTKERANELSRIVIGAAIEVHRTIGPGLLESAYQEALCRELLLRGVPFERQVPLPMEYKGIRLECSYRLDLVVNDLLIVELKSIDRIEPIHEAQLLTYLRLKPLWLGLLINFNVPRLKEGVRRIVNG
jgi:GxxExxY protein